VRLPENISGARTDQELVDLWIAGRPKTTQKLYRCIIDQFMKYLAPPNPPRHQSQNCHRLGRGSRGKGLQPGYEGQGRQEYAFLGPQDRLHAF